MKASRQSEPRILILEPDRETRAMLFRSAVRGWTSASVQTIDSDLVTALAEPDKLKGFDVVLAGCDFSHDGSSRNPTLAATRAVAADPSNPPLILLTDGGSEYTAVQAIKAGAFDCIPRSLLGREQVITAVQQALVSYRPTGVGEEVTGALRFFGYDIRRCLSKHRNVSVHIAFSAERGEEVVLKVLHRGRGSLSLDRYFARFVSEFKLLYDIEDPAVAEIYDFRVTRQYCFIAMEYFPLGHLGRRLKRRLEPRVALELTAEIAAALSIIHAAGIVHRDLKPGNIMLRDDGTAALIDFGISASAMSKSDDARKERASISGTPYYMSPEQARGETTDERTDLYALGVILYQMLTNSKPYTGTSTEYILDQHKAAPLPILPGRLAAYQSLLDRLLAKRIEHRLSNARELIEVIDEIRNAAASEDVDYELSATSL